jgi:hypothetical protein
MIYWKRSQNPTLDKLQSQIDIAPDDLIESYETMIKSVLDSHAPLKMKKRLLKSRPPWFNEEVLCARRDVRKQECLLRHAHSPLISNRLIACKTTLRRAIRHAKKSHSLNQLRQLQNDPKQLWKELLHMSGRRPSPTLPDNMDQ